MLHHYITRYWDEDGRRWVVSWIQLNAFGRCWCFSERRVRIDDTPASPEGQGS